VTLRKGNNFRYERWIAIKLLLEFPDALFQGVGKESILGDDDVWSSQAAWIVLKGHNFRSDRWIAINLLLEFPDALLNGVGRTPYSVMMMSGRARLHGRFARAVTFDPTVGSRSNFYWSFRMLFSMEWTRNRYSVMMRSGLAWLE